VLILEVEQPNAGPDAKKLAALTQFLIGRATNTGATKTISTQAYLQLAQNMGISLSQSQLTSLSQQPPLNGLISNVEPDKVTFKGAEPEVDDSDMSPDQARATVDKMAKRAASKGS
jgi:hypothetical protein